MTRRFPHRFAVMVFFCATCWAELCARSHAASEVIDNTTWTVTDAATLNSPTEIDFGNGTLLFAPSPLTQSNITMSPNLVLGSGGGVIEARLANVTVTGSITGNGLLQLLPDPTWSSFTQSDYTWSGTNNYSGGTVLGAVSVYITGSSQSLGTGEVTVESGGVLGLSSPSNIASGQAVALQPGGVLVLNNAAINPASIVDSNPANTTGGTLSLGVNYSSALNMAAIGNGQLFLGSTGNINYTASTLGAGSGGVYRLGGGSGSPIAAAPVLTFSGTDNLFTGANSVLIGSSAIAGQSEATGSSTIVFANANNYSGGTTLLAGILTVGNDNALGNGTLTFAGGNLNSLNGARTISNPVTFTSGVARLAGTGSLTFAGTVDLGGNTPQIFDSGGGAIFTNTISNGGLNLVGGFWTLAAANTFSGGIALNNNATLSFSSDKIWAPRERRSHSPKAFCSQPLP